VRLRRRSSSRASSLSSLNPTSRKISSNAPPSPAEIRTIVRTSPTTPATRAAHAAPASTNPAADPNPRMRERRLTDRRCPVWQIPGDACRHRLPLQASPGHPGLPSESSAKLPAGARIDSSPEACRGGCGPGDELLSTGTSVNPCPHPAH
jgi:hypothetical protein